MNPRPLLAIVVAFGVVPLGCGGTATKASVTGKVVFKGQTLKTGLVTFVFPDGPRSSAIGPEGVYWIDNLPVGQTAKVQIKPQLRSPFSEKKPPKGAPPTEKKTQPEIAIPEKYQDAAKSGLTWTVRSGEQKLDIELLP